MFKGYVFEIFVNLWDRENGFNLVNKKDSRVHINKKKEISIQGRGHKHQIDCAYDYDTIV